MRFNKSIKAFIPITFGSEPNNSDHHWISTFSSQLWDVKTWVTSVFNQQEQN